MRGSKPYIEETSWTVTMKWFIRKSDWIPSPWKPWSEIMFWILPKKNMTCFFFFLPIKTVYWEDNLSPNICGGTIRMTWLILTLSINISKISGRKYAKPEAKTISTPFMASVINLTPASDETDQQIYPLVLGDLFRCFAPWWNNDFSETGI